jgi:tetratricopeptide (TPR) repeat protein
MRTETRLTDLQPEFRSALHEALTENGWEPDKVQRIVARAYDFLGPFVVARVQRGSTLSSDPESEYLVVDFHAPAGRDLGAAEETYQRACELANAGNVAGALDPLREIVRDFPEVAKYRRNLGQAYFELGNLDKAEDEFLHALALDSRDSAARIMLGNCYQARGAPEKAVPLYRRANELLPDALCFTNLGAALGRLGDLDGAIDAFQQALKLDPNFKKASIGLRMAVSQKLRK